MNSDSPTTEASIVEALRSKGYRATSQRIAICRFALDSRRHPAVQTIYRQVRTMHPTVSLATVYKTIHVLKDLGMVQEVVLPDGDTRFDSYAEPHLNMVCLRCGTVFDFDNRDAPLTVARLAGKVGFKVTRRNLDVYGICKTCRGKL